MHFSYKCLFYRIHHKVIIFNLATNIIENDTSAPQYFTGLVTAQEGRVRYNKHFAQLCILFPKNRCLLSLALS